MKYIRKNKRILTYELEAIENKVDCNVDFAEGLDVYKYVQDLNEKLKTVIILRFFEDMKISEIAKITKTNESTVKSRLYKGLKELKRLIEE